MFALYVVQTNSKMYRLSESGLVYKTNEQRSGRTIAKRRRAKMFRLLIYGQSVRVCVRTYPNIYSIFVCMACGSFLYIQKYTVLYIHSVWEMVHTQIIQMDLLLRFFIIVVNFNTVIYHNAKYTLGVCGNGQRSALHNLLIQRPAAAHIVEFF